MKILHISTYDIVGGAARTAHKIHRQMRFAGIDSRMLVSRKHVNSNDVSVCCLNNGFLFKKLHDLRQRRIRKLSNGFSINRERGPYHHDLNCITRLELKKNCRGSDIINLHWVANFVDYQACFSAFRGRTPVVWRLADMNPFTGGCHYDWDCEKYAKGCGECPHLTPRSAGDLSAAVWKRKNSIFSKLKASDLHIVTLCRWMDQKVEKSPFFSRFPRTRIPNGVDLNVFHPKPGAPLKKKLGIDPAKQVILFLAEYIHVKRKGLQLLLTALAMLEQKSRYALLTVGKETLEEYPASIEHHHLDTVNNNELLADIYNTADLFIVPSIQENFPNTALESFACGTPVVGFRIGGLPDIVDHGVNGFLADEPTSDSLYRCIAHFFDQPADAAEKMGYDAAEKATRNWNLKKQVAHYIDLYTRILEAKSKKQL